MNDFYSVVILTKATFALRPSPEEASDRPFWTKNSWTQVQARPKPVITAVLCCAVLILQCTVRHAHASHLCAEDDGVSVFLQRQCLSMSMSGDVHVSQCICQSMSVVSGLGSRWTCTAVCSL